MMFPTSWSSFLVEISSATYANSYATLNSIIKIGSKSELVVDSVVLYVAFTMFDEL